VRENRGSRPSVANDTAKRGSKRSVDRFWRNKAFSAGKQGQISYGVLWEKKNQRVLIEWPAEHRFSPEKIATSVMIKVSGSKSQIISGYFCIKSKALPFFNHSLTDSCI
jgi:hypothetical protein